MKKTFVLFLSLLLISTFSNTQAQMHLGFGARAGLSFANLSFDPDVVTNNVTKSSRTGFKFGALAELGFVPMFAVQVEPMFATGGSELSGPGGKITYKFSYIEIPILFKVKVPVTGAITPYAFVGPNIAFVMSSKELDELNNTPSKEIDNADYTSSVAFSLDFGAGAGYKVTKQTMIMLDVRYSLGLSNVLNDKGKQAWGKDQSIKPTAFQVVAGVMFEL